MRLIFLRELSSNSRNEQRKRTSIVSTFKSVPYFLFLVIAKVADLTIQNNKDLDFQLADISTFIFVLSAIHPDKHAETIRNLSTFIKPGGSVFMRDYGAMDHAMCRFKGEVKLSDRFYVRQDGTR